MSPPKVIKPPTPTSLPRQKIDEDENNVYWDHTVHPRPHPSTSTPLESKQKRDTTAAEIPSPSKTLIEEEDPKAFPEELAPPALQPTRRDTLERRSLRQNKRLKERQSSSAENDRTSVTTAPATVCDIPEIEALLNRLKEKEGSAGSASKAKTKGNNDISKSLQRQPKTPTALCHIILAPETDTPPITKRAIRVPSPNPAGLLGATVGKPGLRPNQETPTRASAHSNSGPLMPNTRPSNTPAASAARIRPVNGSTERPPAIPFKALPTGRVAKVATTASRLPAVNLKTNSPLLKSTTTGIRPSFGPKKSITTIGVTKPVPIITRAPGTIPNTNSTASGTVTRNSKIPLGATRAPIRAPAPPPTKLKTFQIAKHDESQSLLSGLSADDLAWNSD